ncbi:putative binding protein component of ABC iron transporter [Thiosulfatimonas sediminis]|uniref:Putative binding protein component of ABC iron transporter n=1 Tax=Thiosulfatimonas sediminis TaxID=2675054 RepID=A0A6F8PRL8_9GAMM|nr:extracellular solute-binding protein [Thiosulfatimonas sediminis]BBP44677.1 putative binding protein component of ABC iron transporter [Thiosulfatimonas sediminis]
MLQKYLPNGLAMSLAVSFLLPASLMMSSSGVYAAEDAIVIYSARKEHLIKPQLDEFTKQTGIKTLLYTGKDGALIERVKAESERTEADILMMADAGNLGYAAEQGLFQPLNSSVIKQNIPLNLRDADDFWTGLSVRARTLVYATERLQPNQLKDYEDLADAKWQGKLCLRTSQKVYNKSLVASIIAHDGEAKAEKVVAGWVKNLAAKPYAKDSQVMEAILAGRCDVGIVNTYYFGRLMAEKPDTKLALFWANQETTGTHVNVSGAGIVKASDQVDNARKLIEWLAQDQAQKIYAEVNQEYPANPAVPVSATVAAWGSFKADELSLSEVVSRQQQAVRLMQKAGYR